MSELSELFARDPLKLTREDRRPIIEYYRETRHKYFHKPPALSPEEKKQARAEAKALEGPKKKIDLRTLDLKLED